MRYADFEKLIQQMAVSASDSARRSFSLDSIRRLHASAEDAIRKEYTEAERLLLDDILAGIDQQPAPILKQKLRELDDALGRDPIRSIEFNPLTTDLLCALENWLDYRITRKPKYVAAIAINIVNAIDYQPDGGDGEYSVDNMLGAPEMVAEHERQKRMLVASE